MLRTKTIENKKKEFIVFGKPNISDEEIQAVTDVLKSGWIGTGKVSKQLEEEFVKYMGDGYAVCVSSASIGLVIAFKAVGLGEGDKILTSPLTFCATVNSILQIGAVPVFSEVDKKGCLDSANIDYRKINALVPVHYTGSSCEMISLSRDAHLNGIPIIEDAAHSFGGTFLGQKQGRLGTLSVFSLYATKNITSGEGGIIWTKNKELADRCRLLSNQGQSSGAWGRYNSGPIENYQVVRPGFKGNLSDLAAAIGLVQLRRWPEMKKKRDKIWKIYEEAFGKKDMGHSQHLYTIQVKNRNDLRQKLYERGIGTGINYGTLHLEPAYDFLGYKKGSFPLAEKIGSETLSLPISNSMSENDAYRVVEAVHEYSH